MTLQFCSLIASDDYRPAGLYYLGVLLSPSSQETQFCGQPCATGTTTKETLGESGALSPERL